MIFSKPICCNHWRKEDRVGGLVFLSGYDVLGNGQPTGQAEVVTHLCTKHCFVDDRLSLHLFEWSWGVERRSEDASSMVSDELRKKPEAQRGRKGDLWMYDICMIYGTYTDSETCWFSIRESAYHFLFGSLNKCDVSTDSSDAWCNPEPWGDTSGAGLARSSDHHEAPTVRTATNVCCDTIITAPLSTTASASAITTSLILGKIYKIMFAEFPTLQFQTTCLKYVSADSVQMCWHALDSNINRVGDGRCLEHHCRRVAVMFARDDWSILVESYRLFNIVFHHCSVRIVELSMISAAFCCFNSNACSPVREPDRNW